MTRAFWSNRLIPRQLPQALVIARALVSSAESATALHTFAARIAGIGLPSARPYTNMPGFPVPSLGPRRDPFGAFEPDRQRSRGAPVYIETNDRARRWRIQSCWWLQPRTD